MVLAHETATHRANGIDHAVGTGLLTGVLAFASAGLGCIVGRLVVAVGLLCWVGGWTLTARKLVLPAARRLNPDHLVVVWLLALAVMTVLTVASLGA